MIEYWYRALETPYGIIVQTDNRDRCRAALYAARAKQKDPSLDGLELRFPRGFSDQVWIVKQ